MRQPQYRIVVAVLIFALGVMVGWEFRSVTSSNRNLAGRTNDVEETFLFVAILSSPNSITLRDTIRNTWLRLGNRNRIRHKFFIGSDGLAATVLERLKLEKSAYGDIVTLNDFKDSYDVLSLKLLEVFKWIAKNTDTAYVLKVDDDSLARIDLIADHLSEKPKGPLYWGFFSGNAPVFRKGKWADEEWFLCDRYLPYARGGGYVLSADLVRFAASNADILRAYKSEDVSVGVWLAPLKITRDHDPRFDTEYRSRGCFNAYLVTHKQTEQMMKQKYNSLKQNGVLCPMEVRTRYSYAYNWNVSPSKCCIRNDTKLP